MLRGKVFYFIFIFIFKPWEIQEAINSGLLMQGFEEKNFVLIFYLFHSEAYSYPWIIQYLSYMVTFCIFFIILSFIIIFLLSLISLGYAYQAGVICTPQQ